MRPCAPVDESSPKTLWLYVGTYTNSKTPSEGIYLLELDLASGKLTSKGGGGQADRSLVPGHPPEPQVPLRGERARAISMARRGAASAQLAIDPGPAGCKLLNQQSSVGSGPCHLTVDQTGKNVLVANYGSGSVACLPIEADGTLRPASSFIQHEGKSVDRAGRASPHGTRSTSIAPTASPSRPTSGSTRS